MDHKNRQKQTDPQTDHAENSEGKHRSDAPEQSDETYDDLDPFEIEFMQEFRRGRGPQEPFVNNHGVLIGDHIYESPESPLSNWTKDTDPNVMAGEEWVHPFKDIGFLTAENRDYFERGIPPQGAPFMHPDKDVAYGVDGENEEGEPER